MNKELSASRVSSSSLSPATIPQTFFTSFTTDNQQTWRHTPPLSTATAANQQQHSFNQDFQLFDTESEIPRTLLNSSRGPATASTLPNRNTHRHLSLNTRAAQVSSPSIGHNSTNNHRSYSSPALYPQHRLHHRQLSRLSQLPPVPAFSQQLNQNKTQTILPRTSATGMAITTPHSHTLTHNFPGTMSNEFDSMFLPRGGVPAGDAIMDFHNDFTDFSGNTGTISPHDLMREDSLIMSNPPSTAFPNLSTPDSGYLESPALASSGLNTSPMDDALLDGTLDFGDLESMPPLFPQSSYDQFSQLPSDKLHASSSFTSVNSRPSTGSSPLVRQKSSPGRPPATFHARKFSETAGINKPKPAKKYLPEIAVNSEDDKETAKRKKNTAAARKSRQRKMEITEQMEAEIQRLRGIVYRLGGNPDEDD